jgi:hypothetical protein
MSMQETRARWGRWIWSALGVGTGLAIAIGWSVIVIAANGLTWWRAYAGYNASNVVAALILIVTQIIGGIGVLAAIALLVWRRTLPLAIGVIVGAAIGFCLYLATDALFRDLVA